MSVKAQQQSRIKELITLGREQKYLTYAEVNDHLPEDISDPEQVEDIIRMINDMGIPVHESAPDADALMLADADTDEAAAEEAAAALAAVETVTFLVRPRSGNERTQMALPRTSISATMSHTFPGIGEEEKWSLVTTL